MKPLLTQLRFSQWKGWTVGRLGLLLALLAGSLGSVYGEEMHEPMSRFPGRLSPMVTLGAPNLLNLGFVHHLSPQFKWALDAGTLGVPLPRDRLVSVGRLEVRAQWHPFSGAWFLGAGLGYQEVALRTSLNLSGLSGDVGAQQLSIQISHVYLAPMTGFLWQLSDRWLLGMDIGMQFPFFLRQGGISFSGPMSDPSTQEMADSLEASSRDALSYLAWLPIPQVAILRLGWMF